MSRTIVIVALLSLWEAPSQIAADASRRLLRPRRPAANSRSNGPGRRCAGFHQHDAAGSPERTYGAYAYATSGNPVVVDSLMNRATT
jgi:hypothetical protein